MVSTGKEGVVYNGLSDWLYEGKTCTQRCRVYACPQGGCCSGCIQLLNQPSFLFDFSYKFNCNFLRAFELQGTNIKSAFISGRCGVAQVAKYGRLTGGRGGPLQVARDRVLMSSRCKGLH